MKGADIYRAMGDIDEKHLRSAEKIMEKDKESGTSRILGVLKYAGAAALVLAVVTALWIPSVLFPRDDPADTPRITETENTELPAFSACEINGGREDAKYVNFKLTVSGRSEFCDILKRSGLLSGEIREQNSAQITPDGFYEETGIKLFLYVSNEEHIFALHDGEISEFCSDMNILCAYPCDADGDGSADIIFTASYGSDDIKSCVAIYNTTSKTSDEIGRYEGYNVFVDRGTDKSTYTVYAAIPFYEPDSAPVMEAVMRIVIKDGEVTVKDTASYAEYKNGKFSKTSDERLDHALTFAEPMKPGEEYIEEAKAFGISKTDGLDYIVVRIARYSDNDGSFAYGLYMDVLDENGKLLDYTIAVGHAAIFINYDRGEDGTAVKPLFDVVYLGQELSGFGIIQSDLYVKCYSASKNLYFGSATAGEEERLVEIKEPYSYLRWNYNDLTLGFGSQRLFPQVTDHILKIFEAEESGGGFLIGDTFGTFGVYAPEENKSIRKAYDAAEGMTQKSLYEEYLALSKERGYVLPEDAGGAAETEEQTAGPVNPNMAYAIRLGYAVLDSTVPVKDFIRDVFSVDPYPFIPDTGSAFVARCRSTVTEEIINNNIMDPDDLPSSGGGYTYVLRFHFKMADGIKFGISEDDPPVIVFMGDREYDAVTVYYDEGADDYFMTVLLGPARS